METIHDLTWMRQLAQIPAERFALQGFRIALLKVPNTSEHHAERYRYRLLAFDPMQGKPVLAVNLESDILGDYCLTLETGAEQHILARYESLPSFESFRELAVEKADGILLSLSSRGADADEDSASRSTSGQSPTLNIPPS